MLVFPHPANGHILVRTPKEAYHRTSVVRAGNFDRLIADLCGAFVRATVDEIDEEINRWLKRIVLTLGLDRSTVARTRFPGLGCFQPWMGPGPKSDYQAALERQCSAAWVVKKVTAGETVIFSRLDDLPEEAAVDRESFRLHGTRSNVTIPIRAAGEVVAGVGFASMYRERQWTPSIVEQLQLVAQIFGYAFERREKCRPKSTICAKS